MDFGSLLSFAQKNEKSSASNNYYKARFDPPKKEQKPNANLSSNIQKFLAQKENEERRKTEDADEKRRNLLAMRDPKDKRKIEKMLKVIKSANKSVLSDTLEDETAITASGPCQPDEDDYGYESQVAADLYQKIMDKYSKMPVEEKFPTGGKATVKDLGNTKDRVRAALERDREIENDPQLRRMKRKEARLAQSEDVTDTQNNEPEQDTAPSHISHSAKEEKKKRPSAPPPLDFHELLRLAEQKRHEPVAVASSKESGSSRSDDPIPPRPMTSKERKVWLEEQERLKRRAQRDQQYKQGDRHGQNHGKPAPSAPPSKPDYSKQTDSPKRFCIPKIPKKVDALKPPISKPIENPEKMVRGSENKSSEQHMRKQSDKRPDHMTNKEEGRERLERSESNKSTQPDKYRTERSKSDLSKTSSDKSRDENHFSREKIKVSEKSKSLFDSPKQNFHTSSQKETSRTKEPQKTPKPHNHSDEKIKDKHKELFRKESTSSNPVKSKQDNIRSETKHNNRAEDRHIPMSTKSPNGFQPQRDHGTGKVNSNIIAKQNVSKLDVKDKPEKSTSLKNAPVTKTSQSIQKRPEHQQGSSRPITNIPSNSLSLQKRPGLQQENDRPTMNKPSNAPSLQKRPGFHQENNRPMMHKPSNTQSMQKRPQLDNDRPTMNKPSNTQSMQKRPQHDNDRPAINKPTNSPSLQKRPGPQQENDRPMTNKPSNSLSLQKRPGLQQEQDRRIMNKPSNSLSSQKRPGLQQEQDRPMMNKPFKGQPLQKQPEPQRGMVKPVMDRPPNGQRPMAPPPVRQFPPMDVKKVKKPVKRRIDSESEEDPEMDDFIDDDDDQEDYSSYIKEIFGYDKSKYRHIDEDDSNMESNFAQVMKEEYISKKIGIMEDLEDMRIEAEEKKRKTLSKKMKKN